MQEKKACSRIEMTIEEGAHLGELGVHHRREDGYRRIGRASFSRARIRRASRRSS